MVSVDMAGLLARARTFQAALFSDACTITRTGAPGVLNELTGVRAPAAATTVYSGPCSVQIPQPQPDVPTSAEHRYIIGSAIVRLPIEVVGVREKDIVTMDSVSFDPNLVGRSYVVVAVLAKSHESCRRLAVEETS